jgi:hypothetical protein
MPSDRADIRDTRRTRNKKNRLLARLHEQLGEKYFDYFVFNIVDYIRVNCG